MTSRRPAGTCTQIPFECGMGHNADMQLPCTPSGMSRIQAVRHSLHARSTPVIHIVRFSESQRKLHEVHAGPQQVLGHKLGGMHAVNPGQYSASGWMTRAARRAAVVICEHCYNIKLSQTCAVVLGQDVLDIGQSWKHWVPPMHVVVVHASPSSHRRLPQAVQAYQVRTIVTMRERT